MTIEQHGLTVVAPILAARRTALLDALAAVDNDFRNGRVRAHGRHGGAAVPFGDIDTLHFARLAIVDFAVDPKGCGDPRLIVCVDFDGSPEDLTAALVAKAAGGLDGLFAHCVDYPDGATPAARVATFLTRRQVPENIHFTGAPGRTVEQIRAEAQLRDAIQGFVGRQRQALAGCTSAAVRIAIQQFVRSQRGTTGEPLYAWAEPQHPPAKGISRLRFCGKLAGVAGAAAAAAVREAPQWAAERLRALVSDPPRNPPLTCAEQDLVQCDNLSGDPGDQNKMTTVNVARPGYRWLVGAGIGFIGAAAQHTYFRGELAGIVTIHFARWVMIDRCVLFCSIYDGSWEAYLGEFIDRAFEGLNLLWGSTVGYPTTRWIAQAGARDEQRFKAWVVRHQVPTQVLYSAYPELSISAIRQNTRLRDGLFAIMDDRKDIDAWLGLL
ncbi:MAG: hypothetical protein ACRERC_03340 [Candidatus Binatia bacterium]